MVPYSNGPAIEQRPFSRCRSSRRVSFRQSGSRRNRRLGHANPGGTISLQCSRRHDRFADSGWPRKICRDSGSVQQLHKPDAVPVSGCNQPKTHLGARLRLCCRSATKKISQILLPRTQSVSEVIIDAVVTYSYSYSGR